MDVTILTPEGGEDARLAERQAALIAALGDRFDTETRDGVQALAAALLPQAAPLFFSAEVEENLEWFVAGFELIRDRREGCSLTTLPVGSFGGCMLLISAIDAPYLLDTVQIHLEKGEIPFRIVAHPLFTVERDSSIRLGGGNGVRESFMLIFLERVEFPSSLQEGLRQGFEAAQSVAHDQSALQQEFSELGNLPVLAEHADFFSWLQDGTLLLFGCERRCVKAQTTLKLGLPLPPEEVERVFAAAGDSLHLDELDSLSPVLRLERLTALSLIIDRPDGEREFCLFYGLFAPQSLDTPASALPPLRQRLDAVLNALEIPRDCHDYRKAVEIFNALPKAELFFIPDENLQQLVHSFSFLYRRGTVKVVAVQGGLRRERILLVILPRPYFTDEIVQRMERVVCRSCSAGRVRTRLIQLSVDYLTLHLRLPPGGAFAPVALERLERQLTRVALPWEERLRRLLRRSLREGETQQLLARYRRGFDNEYRTLIHPRFASRDLLALEQVRQSGREVFALWGPFRGDERFYRLQFYSLKPTHLNALMPFLENLGLCVIDEADFSVTTDDARFYIKSFSVSSANDVAHDLGDVRVALLETLEKLYRGEVENDYLNRLIPLTSLSHRQVDLFRAYRNYFFQLGTSFSKRRVAYALIDHPAVAGLLYRYFEARFSSHLGWSDPLEREEKGLSPLRMELVAALEQVSDPNEDQILRTLFNLIDSTVRTNFYLTPENPPPYIAFKISAIGIIDMPAPRPLFEVYVHSATMEGIHLRGGKVARGGIRWSDRPDDFRTEILGLMKTQMTKNVLIVPVGSKGGFIVKTPYADRATGAALAEEAYRTLMRGLLDVTDNRVAGAVVQNEALVLYDEVDPYLVVAADKGTAHLPDTANEESQNRNFWLGDAFASGGSRGYDHKELGITARGAWECVKRHFRELGTDIQSEPFSVVGIGDMSGDVFGNGMLLSRQIRLRAAFDHRHIFLDPDPVPEISYRERERLFKLPTSSWADYNSSLISNGGGVFRRDAKDIELSPEIRQWLGLRHASIDPNALIRALLASEIDLLWNGGIGTYVKASSEKHQEAGDRSNDAVRIDASELSARVVGEGGNLGFTQRGRIEYALAGGRINTDAVDNSAGVDCSDHEVNLKIFMQYLIEAKVVASLDARDTLLGGMSGEVCEAVLENNYQQSLCLSLDQLRCAGDIEPFLQVAERLSAAGLLDRSGEALPSAREVRGRGEVGFTRPELSILMAYSKMHLYQVLLEGEMPLQENFIPLLRSYFPAPLAAQFEAQLPQHPLRGEIVATLITNGIVNQAGASFVLAMIQEYGVSAEQVAATYLACDAALDAEARRAAVFALDNKVSAELQHELLLVLEEGIKSLCRGALEEPDTDLSELPAMLDHFLCNVSGVLPVEALQLLEQQRQRWDEAQVPQELAATLAPFSVLDDFWPVERLVVQSGLDAYSVARIWYETRDYFQIGRIFQLLARLPYVDRWDRLARRSLETGISSACRRIVATVLSDASGNLNTFISRHRTQVAACQRLGDELRTTPPRSYHPLYIYLDRLNALSHGRD